MLGIVWIIKRECCMKKLAIIILGILINLTNFAADQENDCDINKIDPLIFNIDRIGPGASVLDPESKDLTTTFKVIQRLYTLAAQIVRIPGVRDPNHALIFTGLKEPLPWHNQTEQGIYLIMDSHPEALSTPWGEVPLYNLIGCDMCARVFDEFRQCLRLEFVENSGEHEVGNDKLKFYVEQHLEEGYEHEFAKEELDQYRGSDKRIIANYYGRYSWYKVIAAYGVLLPEPKRLAKKDFRKDTIVKENWNIMVERYEADKYKHPRVPGLYSRKMKQKDI